MELAARSSPVSKMDWKVKFKSILGSFWIHFNDLNCSSFMSREKSQPFQNNVDQLSIDMISKHIYLRKKIATLDVGTHLYQDTRVLK